MQMASAVWFYLEKKLNSNVVPFFSQYISSDQLLFESMVNQIYLYFFLNPKLFFESMFVITKQLVKMLRWKIQKGMAIIQPNYILAKSSLFYQVQEILVLLLYYNEDMKSKILAELVVKVIELN